jgi:hypothetical protein
MEDRTNASIFDRQFSICAGGTGIQDGKGVLDMSLIVRIRFQVKRGHNWGIDRASGVHCQSFLATFTPVGKELGGPKPQIS